MRAAVLRNSKLLVDDFEDLHPTSSQILVKPLACGICGSDLHFVNHGQELLDQGKLLEASLSGPSQMDLTLDNDVFMGHEFACEVIEQGPDATGLKEGDIVVSVPVLISGSKISQLAYSNEFPGGFSDQMLLSAPLAIKVPDSLSPLEAAMCEPLAVGVHAVGISGADASFGAVVLGCGPVGLAVISAAKASGIHPILASDYSPLRRELAVKMGADEVVDPSEESIFGRWRKLAPSRRVAVFEAVGIPGMIDSAMKEAPLGTRIVVVGVSLKKKNIMPFAGIAKELEIRFAFAYMPHEFANSLNLLAEGKVNMAEAITKSVTLDELPGAFSDLASPMELGKLIVTPS
ncbi:MAG: zinc-binding dehydrogenase [Acidimicrobiales bacterium]|nr:zinc-binding dehydrogenase [Acidimicrobiales bacterium]